MTRRSVTGEADVVVVGAGIIGCSVAYRLSRSGRSVIVVDAGPCAGAGSTSASSAIVRFHYTLSDNVALAWDSYQAWTDWANEIGGTDPDGMVEYRTTGGILLGPPDEFDLMVTNLTALGIDHEVLSPAQIRTRFPAIDPSRFGPPARLDDPGFFRDGWGELYGLFTPDAGYINDPQLAAHNYQWAAQRHGAEFRYHSRVVDVATSDGHVEGVTLADGSDIHAPILVNAAGPASDQFNELAGVAHRHTIRSRPLRTETHVAPAPPEFSDSQATFVFDPDLGSAFRPEIGGLVHVSNIEPACDELVWVDDPWREDHLPTVEAFETQVLRVARRMPELPIPHRPSGLAALYDVTPDWNPILDRGAIDGLFLACGTSGNSFKTAPTIGHIIKSLIDRSPLGSDAATRERRPEATFTTPRTGSRIDLGHYSRNRKPGPATSVIA